MFEASPALEREWHSGLLLGSLGVLAFSGTLVATREAVGTLGPGIYTFGRIELAAVLAALTLILVPHGIRPSRRHIRGIALAGFGQLLLYPGFVALALRDVPASHGAVVVGLLPAATAVIAVNRNGEQPPFRFWVACLIGTVVVVAFALGQGDGHFQTADLWLLAGIVSAAFGYVEGARVSAELGGARTLCWALLAVAPLSAIPLVIELVGRAPAPVPLSAWVAFAYAAIVSLFFGSMAWYRGLAAGGAARIGQLTLFLPLLGLCWAAWLLGERISFEAVMTAVIVVPVVLICLRSRGSNPKQMPTPEVCT